MLDDVDHDDPAVAQEIGRNGEGSRSSSDIGWPSGISVGVAPVRRVHTRSRRRNTSLVYSTLPLGMRVAESQLEVRFLKVVELEPRATMVRAQPTWLRVMEGARYRNRAVDFAVMIDGRAELHETKQDAECWKPDVRSELLAIRDEVERHPGWRYSVTLESALLAEPLRSNTDVLWRELVPAEELDIELRLRSLSLLDERPLAVAELIEKTATRHNHASASGSWPNLLAMIAGKLIDFDVAEHLTPDSLVWNRNSGPPRRRTLPFGPVEAAIRPPLLDLNPSKFCGLQVRTLPRPVRP